VVISWCRSWCHRWNRTKWRSYKSCLMIPSGYHGVKVHFIDGFKKMELAREVWCQVILCSRNSHSKTIFHFSLNFWFLFLPHPTNSCNIDDLEPCSKDEKGGPGVCIKSSTIDPKLEKYKGYRVTYVDKQFVSDEFVIDDVEGQGPAVDRGLFAAGQKLMLRPPAPTANDLEPFNKVTWPFHGVVG